MRQDASDQSFRLIVDSIPGMIAVSRPDGDLVYVNKSVVNCVGAELAESTNLGWARVVHPEDADVAMNEWHKARAFTFPETKTNDDDPYDQNRSSHLAFRGRRLDRPGNDEIQLDLFLSYGSNSPLYPKWQEYFREYQPPMLIAWGKNDQIFPPAGAEPYKRDLKTLDYHPIDAGHFVVGNEWRRNRRAHARVPRQTPGPALLMCVADCTNPTA